MQNVKELGYFHETKTILFPKTEEEGEDEQEEDEQNQMFLKYK